MLLRSISGAFSSRSSGLRTFVSTSIRKDTVGPPHPISNLRPVRYDSETRDSELNTASHSPWHPYSVNEFSGDVQDIQWRVDRQRLDAFNQAFWVDVSFYF